MTGTDVFLENDATAVRSASGSTADPRPARFLLCLHRRGRRRRHHPW
jgi:hypothetical protein